MSKKLNLIALMILLIGQIILGPMGSGNFAYADDGGLSAGESTGSSEATGGSGGSPDGSEATGGSGGSPDGSEATGGSGGSPDGSDATGGSGGSPDDSEATGGSGGSPDDSEATGGSGGSPDGSEATGGSGGSPDGSEATGGSGGSPDGSEATGGSGGSPDDSEATGGSGGSPDGSGGSPDDETNPDDVTNSDNKNQEGVQEGEQCFDENDVEIECKESLMDDIMPFSKGNPWNGTVKVIKKDPKGNPVEGVEFHLTGPGNSNQYDEKIRTNKFGVAFFENVRHGKMTLTENLPSGQKLCYTDYESFVVADDNSGKKHHEFIFINAPIGMNCDGTPDNAPKAELEVTKKFRDSNNKSLKGTFTLIGPNNYSKTETIENGDDEKFKNLVPGEYTLTEISSTDEETYSLMSPWTFTVTADGKINGKKEYEKTVWNEKTPKAELEVEKKFRGSDSKSLKGTFTLTGPNDYSKTETIDNGKTKTFKDMAPGVYILTETGVSGNGSGDYDLMSPNPLEFTVTAEGKINGESKYEITVWNEKTPPKADLEVEKKFRGSDSKSLKGTFTLTGPDDYSKTETIDNGKTKTFKEMAPGVYTLTETGASGNGSGDYDLMSPNPLEFIVTAEGKINGKSKHKITVWNEKKPPKAELTVTKTYQGLTDTNLEATFILTGPNGYTNEGEVEIGKNGHTFTGMIAGEYTLTEVSSGSDDHEKVGPRTFVVDVNGLITEKGALTLLHGGKKPPAGSSTLLINIENPKIPTASLTVNKTFEDENDDSQYQAEFKLVSPNGYDEEKTITHGTSETFDNLKPGTYTLTETDTTSTDHKTVDSQTFIVDDDGKIEGESTHSLEIENPKIPTASLTVNKTFEDENDDSQYQAKFKLVSPNGYDEEKTITHGASETFNNLKPGTYTLSETNTTSPDHGTVGQQTFEVDDTGNITKVGETNPPQGSSSLTIDIENPKIPTAELTVHKTFEYPYYADPGNPDLLEASFTLTGPDDYVETLTVKDGEQIKFQNLKPGDYTLTEAAVDDYLPMQEKTFTVKDDGTFEFNGLKTRTVEILNEKKTNSFKIVKIDPDVPLDNPTEHFLPGAKFILLDSTGAIWGEKTSGIAGVAEFEAVPYGDYRLIEIEAPNGYDINPEYAAVDNENLQVTDGKAITITDSNEDLVVYVNNNKILEPTGSINLYKHRTGSIGTPLNGVTFSLYKVEGDELVEAGLITSGTDSEAGHLVVENLPYGDYYFVETATIDGYQLDNSTQHKFTIPYMVGPEVMGDPEVINVANTPISTPPGPGPGPDPEPGTGSVTLAKVDVATDEGLGEAVFSLYRVGETDPIQTGLTTDTAGNLTVNNLEPGDYYFIETTAPTGYVLDATTQHSFTITASQLAVVEVTNTKFTGSVTLFKKDSETDEGLSGAVFSLYQDGEDEAIQTGLTTNADGNLTVSGLAAGGYYFVETAAPEGYVLDGTLRPFTISSTQIANVQVEVANTAISDTTGSVTLYKVNSDTGEALNGATFAIYRVVDGEEDTLVLGGLITGGVGQPDGYISASDLPMGSYYIIETAASEGYELGDTPPRIDFNITAGMTAVLDLGTVANTPETTGGGGGGGSGGGPTPTPVTPTPSPETPNEEVEETPQPESPNEEVEETPLPESPNVPVEETPQPEAPIIVEEQPQPEAPSVTVEKPSKPESPSVTVKEQPRPQASKGSPTLPRTGEEMPIATLIGGLVLIMLGGWLLLGRRKRNKTQM
ncbi:LPXTG cell wall anchor domain-containing protein [Sporosarcina sp. ACRSM]|uniref:SpaA isopeptide-forming pilin-related protein n=1 Tax=Sporosarcina sp. ACRSM TaxID=2918216 RepID=UPI001EF67E12|nr:SpaA isopeptide-forming pilin-related protein [Sporosarcina sp. ACRSM]MCG7336505.1 LPXTG cell wall anchor domain-containing protein [Sporosarcina sp. ACRSM]